MKNLNISEIGSDTDRTINFVKDVVAAYYNLDKENFNKNSRKSDVIKLKHIAIYIIKKNIKISTVSLGSKFGFNHATVVYIIKKFNGYLEWDSEFRKEIIDIENILNFKFIDELNMNKDYYYIPLNEFVSIKQDNNKAIILKGFTEEEINAIEFKDNRNGNNFFNNPNIIKKHENQNLYILEKKYDESNKNIS